MNWLQSTIRAWLGLDSLPSIEMYKAMEKKQKERHDELLTKLNAIETRVTNARQIQNQAPVVQYVDWEQVQSMALQQIRDEDKEN